MSSATSIDPVSAERVAHSGRDKASAQRDAFKPWHFFVLASLLAATVAVVMARQSRPEHLVLISITIGAAGFAAAALHRTLAPLVSADRQPGPEPLTGSLRGILEREKQLALRAIKELEFDRAMGKISEKDFDEMAARLRQRAMSLIKQLESGATGYQQVIEGELNARLRTRQGGAPAPAAAAAATSHPNADGTAACACGTLNDADAAFCKRCGAQLAR